MPLYNLKCTKCGFIFETLLSINSKNSICPKCEGITERLLSIPAIKISGYAMSTPVHGDGINEGIGVTSRVPHYADRNTGKSLGFGTPETLIGC